MYWDGLPEIAPSDVFETYDATEYAECLTRAEALLAISPRIGQSAYSYAGAMPYDQALVQMKKEHPGFSEESYSEVCAKGMFEMR